MRAILGTIALEPNRWTPYHEPKTDVLQMLPKIKATGFDKLELWQWHVTSRCIAAIRDMKAKGDELGVSFPYIGVYPFFCKDGIEANEQERMRADVIDKAEVLGAKAFKIMLGAGVKGGEITAQQMKLTVTRFSAWYKAAKSRGIGMCAEIHGGSMFDPPEVGMKFMKDHPDLDFSICFQPMDMFDTEKALVLADMFTGKITHIHLQAPTPPKTERDYNLLADGAMDFRKLLPHILKKHPSATMTLEFVKGCLKDAASFDIDYVLANARKDADFVERILG